MKKKLLSILLLLALLSVGSVALASFQVDQVRRDAPDEVTLTASQEDAPVLSQQDEFLSSNLTQPGLECYVKGTFTWEPGQDVRCLYAKGGVTMLPEGWTLVDQDISIQRGLFGWKETAVYHCTLKTLAGVTQGYTAVLSVTRNGTALQW